jgi:hypothetical protein
MKPKDFTDLFCSNEIGLRRRCYTHPADGSSEQCVDYVSKDDTRIAGTEPYVRGEYREIAARQSRQGERTDLTALQEAIHEGKSMEDLQADHFEAFCKYDKFLTKYYIDFHQRGLKRKLIESTSGTVLRPWQQSVMNLVSGPVEDRKVRWYYYAKQNRAFFFSVRGTTIRRVCDARAQTRPAFGPRSHSRATIGSRHTCGARPAALVSPSPPRPAAPSLAPAAPRGTTPPARRRPRCRRPPPGRPPRASRTSRTRT